MKRCIAVASASLLFALAAPLALGQSSGKPEKPAREGQPSKEHKAKKDKLKVGDPAPALKVDKWVKGDPVKSFEKGTVYVVEFWATWCPPCRDSIPHLTELQHKYKDSVVVIGVDGSERATSSGADNRLGTIEKFVKQQGEKMDYRVAYDSNGSAVKPYMQAAGQDGIPTAFLVDGDGKIAWIGHPMQLDSHLEKVAKTAKPKAKETDKERDKGKK